MSNRKCIKAGLEANATVKAWEKDLASQAAKACVEMWKSYEKLDLWSRTWSTAHITFMSSLLAPWYACLEAYEAGKRIGQDVARDYNGRKVLDFVYLEGTEEVVVTLRANARYYVKLVIAGYMGDLEETRKYLGWTKKQIDAYVGAREKEEKGCWFVNNGILDISLLGGVTVDLGPYQAWQAYEGPAAVVTPPVASTVVTPPVTVVTASAAVKDVEKAQAEVRQALERVNAVLEREAAEKLNAEAGKAFVQAFSAGMIPPAKDNPPAPPVGPVVGIPNPCPA